MASTESIKSGYRTFLRLERSYSPNTIDAYMRDVERLLEYLESIGVEVADATLKNLQAFSQILADLGCAPATHQRILSGVRSLYRYMELDGLIKESPALLLESPKKGLHLPDVLSVDEVDAMENAIDLSRPDGERNRAMIEVMYSCGLRVSELCTLRLSGLFLEDGFIRVRGKGSKDRLVPIGRRAVKYLNAYFQDRIHMEIAHGEEDYVFLGLRTGKHLSRVMVFMIVKALVAEAGIVKEVSPHTFRHSFATHLLDGGANLRAIQQMLGHESVATTEIYTHIENRRLREEILAFHPRNRKKSDK